MCKNINISHYFNQLTSTNDKLASILDNADDFTLVYTFNQIEGRGYNENKWISEPNKNLTFSFLLNLDEMTKNLVYLNFWVINNLHIFFATNHLVNNELYIKWPNDLILNKSKIAGVLIENKIQKNKLKSIIGIGINVNQINFNQLPNASSIFNETGIELELEKLLFDLIDFFKLKYKLLFKNNESLLSYYNNFLFKKNKIACFQKDNHNFNAIIKSVNKNGDLELIDENYKLIRFKHKEVKLLF